MNEPLQFAGADLYRAPKLPHMHAAIQMSSLTPAAKRVLKWVVQRATGGWSTIRCGLQTIADALRVSYKTVQRAMTQIRELGILEVHQAASICGAPVTYRPHLELVTSTSLQRVAKAAEIRIGAALLALSVAMSAPCKSSSDDAGTDRALSDIQTPDISGENVRLLQGTEQPPAKAESSLDPKRSITIGAVISAARSAAKKACTHLAGAFGGREAAPAPAEADQIDGINALLQMLADDCDAWGPT